MRIVKFTKFTLSQNVSYKSSDFYFWINKSYNGKQNQNKKKPTEIDHSS